MLSPYDPDGMTLSEDVSLYLTNSYENKHRASNERFILHIYSDTPVDENHIERALRMHCVQLNGNLNHLMKVETLKEICLAILGLILLTVWFVFSQNHDSVWMEVLSIIGWVSIWEAASIAFMRRPEANHVRRTLKHIAESKIVFHIAENGEAAQ